MDGLQELSDEICSAHAHIPAANEGVEEPASARTEKLAHALRLVPHLRSDHVLEVYSGGRARACALTVHTAARRTTRMSERSLLGGVLQHDRARAWVRCRRVLAGACDWPRRRNTHRAMTVATTLSRQLLCRRPRLHITNRSVGHSYFGLWSVKTCIRPSWHAPDRSGRRPRSHGMTLERSGPLYRGISM